MLEWIFAFVEYNETEDAERALRELEKFEFEGRSLTTEVCISLVVGCRVSVLIL